LTEGQSAPFPIDFADRPYNTFTLLCDRLIKIQHFSVHYCSYFGYSCCSACLLWNNVFSMFPESSCMTIGDEWRHCQPPRLNFWKSITVLNFWLIC